MVQRRAEKNIPMAEVGDVGLVYSDNKRRYEWPLGRIIELFSRKDNKVRVTKVKTDGFSHQTIAAVIPCRDAKEPKDSTEGHDKFQSSSSRGLS